MMYLDELEKKGNGLYIEKEQPRILARLLD